MRPVFDFRAHFCHSAPIETRFRLQTPGQRPGGPKAISYQFTFEAPRGPAGARPRVNDVYAPGRNFGKLIVRVAQ